MSRIVRTAGKSLAASVATHGALLLLAAWLLTVIPSLLNAPPPQAPDAKPLPQELAELQNADAIEINFVDLIAQLQKEKEEASSLPEERNATAAAPPRKVKRFLPSRDGQIEQAQLNKYTSIISDKDSRASAKNAPEEVGDPSLPSQMGHDIPALSLINSDFSGGDGGPPFAPANSTPPEPEPPAPEFAQTPPAAVPFKKQQPDPDNAIKTDSPDAIAPAKPELALRDSILMENNIELPVDIPPPPGGINRPASPRPPAPPKPFSPPRDPVNSASARKAPGGGRRSLSSVKTRVKGGLAPSGDEDNVDALATPEGRYAKAVRDVIGPLWNARLAGVSGLAGTGVVEVLFDIDAGGRVSNVRLANPDTASAVLNDVCLSAITNARLPAPPEELRKEMADPITGDKLRRTFTFYRL